MIFDVSMSNESKWKPCTPKFEFSVSASFHNVFLFVIYFILKIRTYFLVLSTERSRNDDWQGVPWCPDYSLYTPLATKSYCESLDKSAGWAYNIFSHQKAKKLLKTAMVSQNDSGGNVNKLSLTIDGITRVSIKVIQWIETH